jgi:hypothetical protein
MESAMVAEAGEAVGERRFGEACELLLTRALDPPAIPNEPAEEDKRHEESEAEQQRYPDQLRELGIVHRPLVVAARKDGFCSPRADGDGDRDKRDGQRSKGAAVQDGHVLEGSDGNLHVG